MPEGYLTDTRRADFNGGLQLLLRAGCDNHHCTVHIVLWFDDYPLEGVLPATDTIMQRLKSEGWAIIADEVRQTDLTFFCPKHAPRFTIEPVFKDGD